MNRRGLLVLAGLGLVYCTTSTATIAQDGGVRTNLRKPSAQAIASGVITSQDPSRLPPAVADMRHAILYAVESGDIADLSYAIELNQVPPDFGAPAGTDPITYLKSVSGDGQGLEILAILGRLLDAGYAAIPGGKDIENNRIFVWPEFAELKLDDLAPHQTVSLYRLITPAQARSIQATGHWTWWRLMIGADGIWHSFKLEK